MTPTPDEIARKIGFYAETKWDRTSISSTNLFEQFMISELESYAKQKVGEEIKELQTLHDELKGDWIAAELENERLEKFAVKILSNWPDGDVDGGDLQEIATECGILVPTEVTEPCGDYCQCAEYGDFPQTCYRLSPSMIEAKRSLSKSEKGSGKDE